MKSKSIQVLRIPSLILAAALQVLPLVRTALPAAETATNILAIVFRWSAGVAAALGGVQAVSGASTVITNPLSTNIVQGNPFTLRLTTAPDQAHYWTASGLPAGLALSGTSGSTAWKITGTPSVSGAFNVGLTAKDQATSSGSRTVTATLVLNISPGVTPPAITTPPQSLTVTQNQSATFSVVAAGTGPFSYQWRFNAGVLAGGTNSTFSVNPATTNNAGGYDVIVSNSGGSVTSAVATLTVVLPPPAPVITSPPASLTVTQGQSALFSVTASSSLAFSYQWRFNAGALAGQTGSTLSVNPATTNNAGSYDVIVSNTSGSVTSQVATLTVIVPGSSLQIISQPSSLIVTQGQAANFSVGVSGTPPVNYQWRFNNSNMVGQTSSTLTISAATANNAGAYNVLVSNGSGSITSAVANLTVLIPPTLSSQPQSRTNLAGTTAVFSVTAAGTAPLGYQWSKAGVNLVNDGHFAGVQSSQLSIANVQTNDAGTYAVVVTNSAGAAFSLGAVLTVTPPPVVRAPLTVQISGVGTVTPNYNGQLLQVGASYTVTAIPGSGYSFSSWSGGVSSATPVLAFVMQSNLVLRANFVSDAVTFVAGTYSGLFYESNDISYLHSGAVKVTATGAGKYSGAVQLLGNKYSFAGQLSAAGHATNTIPRHLQSALTVRIDLSKTDSDQISGTVGDGSWTATLQADRAVFNGKTTLAPQAGTYTVLMPGVSNAADAPAGHSYGTVTVDASGRVLLKGVLADGSKMTQSAMVSKTGEWPFCVPLYRGQGLMIGWLLFSEQAGEDLGGMLDWSKGQQPSSKFYPMGFAFEARATGSKYLAAPQNRVLNFNRGKLMLARGNLAQSFTNQIVLSFDNSVGNLSDNKLSLSINLRSGTFKGSVAEPGTGRSIPIGGVVLQKQNYGGGFFLDLNQSGPVYLGP